MFGSHWKLHLYSGQRLVVGKVHMRDGFEDLMGDCNMFKGSFIYADDTLNNFFEVVRFNLCGPNDSFLALNSLYQFFVAFQVDCALLHLLEDRISKLMIFARGTTPIAFEFEAKLAQLLLGRYS
jgi:hypothetical protein